MLCLYYYSLDDKFVLTVSDRCYLIHSVTLPAEQDRTHSKKTTYTISQRNVHFAFEYTGKNVNEIPAGGTEKSLIFFYSTVYGYAEPRWAQSGKQRPHASNMIILHILSLLKTRPNFYVPERSFMYRSVPLCTFRFLFTALESLDFKGQAPPLALVMDLHVSKTSPMGLY